MIMNLCMLLNLKKMLQKEMYKAEFDLLDATRSPLITHDLTWVDCVPKRIRDIVTPARLAALKNREELATLPECLCYLTTRSFTAPLDSDWAEIFLYLTCTVMEKYFGEDHWSLTGGRKELSRNMEDQLIGLRRHIYNSRRKILKQRLRYDKSSN